MIDRSGGRPSSRSPASPIFLAGNVPISRCTPPPSSLLEQLRQQVLRPQGASSPADSKSNNSNVLLLAQRLTALVLQLTLWDKQEQHYPAPRAAPRPGAPCRDPHKQQIATSSSLPAIARLTSNSPPADRQAHEQFSSSRSPRAVRRQV